jgi:hypothetical protein
VIPGKVTDYGDLLHVEQWLVKGKRLDFRWRIGAPVKATKQYRERTFQQTSQAVPGKVMTVMDLQSDKKVTLTVEWTDEMGNPTEAPTGGSVSFSADDPSGAVALTDNGDGTCVVAATGTLGSTNIHASVNAPGFPLMSGDLQIVVVAGLAERINITTGTPEEVTPDA